MVYWTAHSLRCTQTSALQDSAHIACSRSVAPPIFCQAADEGIMRCQDVFFLQELERSANKELQPCGQVDRDSHMHEISRVSEIGMELGKCQIDTIH